MKKLLEGKRQEEEEEEVVVDTLFHCSGRSALLWRSFRSFQQQKKKDDDVTNKKRLFIAAVNISKKKINK